jgi:NTE family protein
MGYNLMTNPSKKTIAVALSGGAARCIAHIGVLQALEEAGIRPDFIAGTSGGALVGALYLDGMPIAELAETAAKTRWRDLLSPGGKTGFVDSRGIYLYMKKLLKAGDFKDLQKPFAAVCADLATGDKVNLTSGPLASALQASASLPVVFTPAFLNNRQLIDGGYVSMVPVETARELWKPDVVLAVDVNFGSTPEPKLTNIVSIAVHLAVTYARKNTERELKMADAAIRVNVGGIGLTDIHKHGELMERGRQAADESMPDIIRKLRG